MYPDTWPKMRRVPDNSNWDPGATKFHELNNPPAKRSFRLTNDYRSVRKSERNQRMRFTVRYLRGFGALYEIAPGALESHTTPRKRQNSTENTIVAPKTETPREKQNKL